MSKYRSLNRAARRRAFDSTNQPTFASPTNPSYAGNLSGFITPAVKSGDTLANGYVNVLDGIDFKAVLQNTTIDDGILAAGGAAACDFSSNNSVTLKEQVLTLDEFKVNEQLCRAKFVPSWVSAGGTRHGDISSAEFKNFLLATTSAKVAEAIENHIWKGSGIGVGLLGEDGTAQTAAHFAASRLGSATTQDIESMTHGNVVDQMGAVYEKAATSVPGILTKPDTFMYVSNKTAALYRQALAKAGGHDATGTGQGYNNQVTNQALTGLNFLGVPIAECSGMYDDMIVVAQRENLYVGTNLQTDLTEVKYIPVHDYDGSDNVRIVMRFGLGTQAGIPADAVVGAIAAVTP